MAMPAPTSALAEYMDATVPSNEEVALAAELWDVTVPQGVRRDRGIHRLVEHAIVATIEMLSDTDRASHKAVPPKKTASRRKTERAVWQQLASAIDAAGFMGAMSIGGVEGALVDMAKLRMGLRVPTARCICGYDAADANDLDEHILGSLDNDIQSEPKHREA